MIDENDEMQAERDKIRLKLARRIQTCEWSGVTRKDLMRLVYPVFPVATDRLLGELERGGFIEVRTDARSSKRGRRTTRYYWRPGAKQSDVAALSARRDRVLA